MKSPARQLETTQERGTSCTELEGVKYRYDISTALRTARVLWIIRPHPSTLLVSALLAALIHFRTVESPLSSATIPLYESKEIGAVTLYENMPRRPVAECRSSKLYCTKVSHALFGKRRKCATTRLLASTRSTAIMKFFGVCQCFLRFIDEEESEAETKKQESGGKLFKKKENRFADIALTSGIFIK